MELDPDILRSVLESPDSDEPRLIAADWWDDSGDPSRAEFIRIQVELSKSSHLEETSHLFGGECVVMECQKVIPGKPQYYSDRYLWDSTPEYHGLISVKDHDGPFRRVVDSLGIGDAIGSNLCIEAVTPDGERRRMFMGSFTVKSEYTDKENRRVKVVVTPSLTQVGGGQIHDSTTVDLVYHVTWTDAHDRYYSLKKRERVLLGENARRWADGPWFEDKHIAVVEGPDNAVLVKEKQFVGWENRRCEFTFRRGFIHTAQFNCFDESLIKYITDRNPCKVLYYATIPEQLDQLRQAELRRATGLPETLFGYPVVIEPPVTVRRDDQRDAYAAAMIAMTSGRVEMSGRYGDAVSYPRSTQPPPEDMDSISRSIRDRIVNGPPILLPNSATLSATISDEETTPAVSPKEVDDDRTPEV